MGAECTLEPFLEELQDRRQELLPAQVGVRPMESSTDVTLERGRRLQEQDVLSA